MDPDELEEFGDLIPQEEVEEFGDLMVDPLAEENLDAFRGTAEQRIVQPLGRVRMDRERGRPVLERARDPQSGDVLPGRQVTRTETVERRLIPGRDGTPRREQYIDEKKRREEARTRSLQEEAANPVETVAGERMAAAASEAQQPRERQDVEPEGRGWLGWVDSLLGLDNEGELEGLRQERFGSNPPLAAEPSDQLTQPVNRGMEAASRAAPPAVEQTGSPSYFNRVVGGFDAPSMASVGNAIETGDPSAAFPTRDRAIDDIGPTDPDVRPRAATLGAVNSLTRGWADDLAEGLGADPEAANQMRQDSELAREQAPSQYMLGQVLGDTPYAAAGGQLAGRVSHLSIPERMGAMATFDAGSGALQGWGDTAPGEDPTGNILTQAGLEAGLGMAGQGLGDAAAWWTGGTRPRPQMADTGIDEQLADLSGGEADDVFRRVAGEQPRPTTPNEERLRALQDDADRQTLVQAMGRYAQDQRRISPVQRPTAARMVREEIYDGNLGSPGRPGLATSAMAGPQVLEGARDMLRRSDSALDEVRRRVDEAGGIDVRPIQRRLGEVIPENQRGLTSATGRAREDGVADVQRRLEEQLEMRRRELVGESTSGRNAGGELIDLLPSGRPQARQGLSQALAEAGDDIIDFDALDRIARESGARQAEQGAERSAFDATRRQQRREGRRAAEAEAQAAAEQRRQQMGGFADQPAFKSLIGQEGRIARQRGLESVDETLPRAARDPNRPQIEDNWARRIIDEGLPNEHRLPWDTVEGHRRSWLDHRDQLLANPSTAGLSGDALRMNQAFRNAESEALGQMDSGLREMFEENMMRHHTGRSVLEGAAHHQDEISRNRILSLTDYMGGLASAGGVAGGALGSFGGPGGTFAGALAGGALGATANKFFRAREHGATAAVHGIRAGFLERFGPSLDRWGQVLEQARQAGGPHAVAAEVARLRRTDPQFREAEREYEEEGELQEHLDRTFNSPGQQDFNRIVEGDR